MIKISVFLFCLIIAFVLAIFKVKKIIIFFILILETLSFLFGFIFPSIGFYLFGGISFLLLALPFIKTSLIIKKRESIFFFIPIILVFLFNVFNYPGIELISFTLIFPIIIFIVLLFNHPKPYSIISYMLFFVGFSVLRLLDFFI